MKGVFITGTDTGIGKTYFTLACIHALQAANIKTTAMKPVASGAEGVDGQLRNQDATLIQQALNHDVDYDLINPYAFASPVSPHIAAAEAGLEIDLKIIQQHYRQLTEHAEFAVVESVGGWLAPLSNKQTVADMAKLIGLPVVMVVGVRLGCLNHAMLTAQAIKQSGMKLTAWVANCIEPALASIDEQIDYLSRSLGMAPLVKLEWGQDSPLCSRDLLKLEKC